MPSRPRTGRGGRGRASPASRCCEAAATSPAAPPATWSKGGRRFASTTTRPDSRCAAATRRRVRWLPPARVRRPGRRHLRGLPSRSARRRVRPALRGLPRRQELAAPVPGRRAPAHRLPAGRQARAHPLPAVPRQHARPHLRAARRSPATPATEPDYDRTKVTSIDHATAGFSRRMPDLPQHLALLAGAPSPARRLLSAHVGLAQRHPLPRLPHHADRRRRSPATCTIDTLSCTGCHAHECARSNAQHSDTTNPALMLYQCVNDRCYECHVNDLR